MKGKGFIVKEAIIVHEGYEGLEGYPHLKKVAQNFLKKACPSLAEPSNNL